MNEIVIIGLAMGFVFSFICSLVLLKMGQIIDRFPTGHEEARERSIASPVEFTRLSVILFWILFVIGSLMVLQGTRVMLVAGIATLFGICLYLITAVIFSFAVFNLMQSRKQDPSGVSPPSFFSFGVLKRPARPAGQSSEKRDN